MPRLGPVHSPVAPNNFKNDELFVSLTVNNAVILGILKLVIHAELYISYTLTFYP